MPIVAGSSDPVWRRFRAARTLVVMLWLGWIPFVSIIVSAERAGLPAGVFTVVMILYGATFLGAGLVLNTWKCPRCGAPFAFRSGFRFRSPWPNTCVHCGLRVGDPVDGDEWDGF